MPEHLRLSTEMSRVVMSTAINFAGGSYFPELPTYFPPYRFGLLTREKQMPIDGVLHIPHIPAATHNAAGGVGLDVQQKVTDLVRDHMPQHLSRVCVGVRNVFHGKVFDAVVEHRRDFRNSPTTRMR